MRPKFCFTIVLCIFTLASLAKVPAIFYLTRANSTEILAAKELQRYIYLRTGVLPTLSASEQLKDLPSNAIVVATSSIYKTSFATYKGVTGAPTLKHDEYQLKSTSNGSLLIIGGSDIAVLYGAYKFLESTGIVFEIHDDLIPDKKINNINLLGFNKIYSPSFELRGIQPFHDFPEGPDWWNKDDYEAIITQLPKLGMNFIGFHTYPETKPFGGWNKAEPMVWIGSKEDINTDGTVNKAYPVLHANTGDSTWAYYPKKTSGFSFGASQIFESDIFGADYMKGVSNWPHTDQENVNIFNDFGKVLSSSFTLAKELGVKTCIGTETPLVVPEQVKHGFQNDKKIDSDSLNRALYEGVFTRIMRTHPLDYYWFWTPESWTWEGEAKGAVEQTEKDLQNAMLAATNVKAPFTLATCGWVLGPARDRSEFDKLLPKTMPFGVINRQQGYTPVETSFNNIKSRPKWEISWLEDDPALTTPQFWAGRTRKDAIDAFKYGCTGFMGIHWRTENLSPAFMALADAGWNAKAYTKKIPSTERDYPVEDLYLEWAKQQFGANAAKAAAAIFINLDGAPLYVPGKNQISAKFPRSSEWGNRGPGKISINQQPWDEVQKNYVFIEQFKKLKPTIKGTSNTERYLYWLNTFLYAQTQAHIGCLLGQMQIKANQLKNSTNKALLADSIIKIRQHVVDLWPTMITQLLQTVNTTGEMGTLANLEQHSLGSLKLINAQDSLIEATTGRRLAAFEFRQNYDGPSRIIITTKRSMLKVGEDLIFNLRVLSKYPISDATIYWRELGTGLFKTKVLNTRIRNVFPVTLGIKEFKSQSFEYYIKVKAGNQQMRYPTAENSVKSVVIW